MHVKCVSKEIKCVDGTYLITKNCHEDELSKQFNYIGETYLTTKNCHEDK